MLLTHTDSSETKDVLRRCGEQTTEGPETEQDKRQTAGREQRGLNEKDHKLDV